MTKKLRYFCTLLLMAVVGVAWAQSDYSTTETSNVALAAGTNGSACTVNGENGIKVGTSSKGGDMKVTVPAGTAYLHVHAAAWNNVSGLSLNISGATASPTSIALTSDSGVSGNSPFTLSGNASDYYFVIELSDITAETTLTFTTSIAKRFVIWGVNAEEDGGSGSTLEDNDLALTGAPVALTFDLYDNAEPQVINYTTSSTGAVTIPASNFFDTAIDETNKTITVTPVAVTNGVKEATVNQAADETYKAGSATFTVDITDSTPFSGGDVTFVGGTDRGTSTDSNNGDEVSKQCVTISSTKAAFNYSEYRIYSGSTTTISTTQGTITKIVFTKNGNYSLANLSTSTGTYDSSTGIWTGDAQSVSFSASAQVRLNQIDVTVTMPGDDPYISANNVNIAYDATSGEIAYTITNPVPGTLLQATADADWVSDITVGDEAITFTTTANEANTERVATFTLTYEGAEDKTVTVTQAGNPNIIDKIENISESGVPYNVQGTVVATSARAFVIGDGTGFIYTYLGSAPSWSVGDMVKISGTTSSYNQVIQFPNSATITVATESEYTPLTPAAMSEVPDYTSGLYKSDYYQFEGMLTKEGNYYVVAVGEGQIRISYPSTSQTTELDALLNKMVKVNGFFAGNSANGSGVFTAIMESIEEVVSEDPAVTLANYNISVAAEGGDAILTVQYQNIDDIVPDIQFYEEDGTTETTAAYYEWLVAELDNDNNVNYVVMDNTGEERKAYFKVFALVGEDYVYSDMITITQEAKEAANVTWNLSIDETATASTTEMSWTSDFATMKVEKAGAGTNTNNYYPGTTGQTYTSTRFYKNSELTISPNVGYKITKIEFTATTTGYASALNNSTWTNATAAVDGTNVAVTPTNGNLAMVATIGGTCGFTGVKVYYEESDVMVIEIKNGFTATTFSCNKALDFTNADVTAQIITDEVGTTQTVRVVPAETGLYITGEPGIHEIPVADASAEIDNVDSNKLKAVMEDSQFATQNSVTFYAFGKQKGKEAFYKIPTSGYNVPAGKAVLRITKANAPEMIVVNGGTTAIDNSQLTIDSLDGEWFDLSGRKVSNGQIQKGIYIVGGRKVVVK